MKSYLSNISVAIILLFSLASLARPFDEVMSAMISVVPKKENVFKKGLEDILSSFQDWQSSDRYCFTPPEEEKKIKDGFWDKVSAFLSREFGPSDKLHGWRLELFNIYTDKLDYKNYVPKKAKDQSQKAKVGCGCVLF